MRMSYETYSALRSMLEAEQAKIHTEFVIALGFMPHESNGKNVALDKANDVYMARRRAVTTQLEELHAAAAATYKDHPNPDMRKFWGLQ
jgi:hypothetical protein